MENLNAYASNGHCVMFGLFFIIFHNLSCSLLFNLSRPVNGMDKQLNKDKTLCGGKP